MNSQKFETLISSPRFNRYLIAASNKPERAQKLYITSLKVAQAMHPLLGLTEIVLRNKLDSSLVEIRERLFAGYGTYKFIMGSNIADARYKSFHYLE